MITSDFESKTLSQDLRYYSKFLVLATLFLVFAGSLVTSTESGLSVPDWPLSYGMLFPPMVGGVFYEHGHRLIAASVGFFTIVLVVWLTLKEKRNWLKNLGYAALGVVITQGVLGGLTVLFLLPKPISISHALLGQTFFCITIVVAYGLSRERALRLATCSQKADEAHPLANTALILTVFVYLQLLLGALMRHTHSGLAIYDFPTMAGQWWPSFNDAMLQLINSWRVDRMLDPVTYTQVAIHLIHRIWALVVVVTTLVLSVKAFKTTKNSPTLWRHVMLLNGILILQVTLGIFTIWSGKAPYITSFHVVMGALFLGLCVLLCLRTWPLQLKCCRSDVKTPS